MIELDEELMSPELQRYLNRNYWEQKQKDSGDQVAPAKSMVSVQQTATSAVTVTTPSAPPSSQSEPTYSMVSDVLLVMTLS